MAYLKGVLAALITAVVLFVGYHLYLDHLIIDAVRMVNQQQLLEAAKQVKAFQDQQHAQQPQPTQAAPKDGK